MMRLLRRLAVLAVVALLGIANFRTQAGYLAESAQPHWAKTLERASALSTLPPGVPVAIGMQDTTVPLLAALYTQGHVSWSVAGATSTPLVRTVDDRDDPAPESVPDGLHDAYALASQVYRSERFYLQPEGLNHHFRRFLPPPGLDLKDTVVLLPARDLSVVNGSQDRPADGRFYTARLEDQRDTLVQIDSSLGHIIVPGRRSDIGLWQFEGDFTGSPRGMQATGRHILFEVLGPVPGSRLLLDFSSGARAGLGFALPPAVVYGTEQQRLDFAGRGAGRVLSAPVEPREIDGHYYIALDLDQALNQFQGERHGLAALYNADLALDTRDLVGFVRNISLLTPEQAVALQPPAAVAGLPAGLLAPGLQFSGVAEDGWVADRAWFGLATTKPSDRLRIKGDIAGFSQKLLGGAVNIRVDGDQVGEHKLTPGNLDLDLPIPPKSGPRRIEIEATATDVLPQPDGRLVSFHLGSVELITQAGAGAAP